jgi:hypothetical protein
MPEIQGTGQITTADKSIRPWARFANFGFLFPRRLELVDVLRKDYVLPT